MEADTPLFDTAFWITSASIFALLMMSAFFSGSETALTAASRARIHQRARKGDRRARIVRRLGEDKETLLGALLLGNNLVNILASAIATYTVVLVKLKDTMNMKPSSKLPLPFFNFTFDQELEM